MVKEEPPFASAFAKASADKKATAGKEKFSVVNLVNNDGCFDLQFRKDTRHERAHSPTYYRWKAQFIITVPKENVAMLRKAKKIIGCGLLSVSKPFGTAHGRGQARFSVQKLEDITKKIIPFFTKNTLDQAKKKQYDLWQKAVVILQRNKGIALSNWKKNDLLHLMEIHKSMAKYKYRPRKQKWAELAKSLANTL